MAFKYKRGIKVSYDRQGYIFFLCRRFRTLPKDKKDAIRALCQKTGGPYARALLRFLTTADRATKICMEEYISEATLYRAVKRFYESFPDDL